MKYYVKIGPSLEQIGREGDDMVEIMENAESAAFGQIRFGDDIVIVRSNGCSESKEVARRNWMEGINGFWGDWKITE